MSDPQQYRYDVFISYSQDDHEWVWQWLLPRLEAAGLSVCLDDSCFELGAPKAEETERVVRESRRTLVILSPGLVASQWDQFEALLVHAQDPAASGRRLIPLLLEPCDPPERIKLLQWVDFSEPARAGKPARARDQRHSGKCCPPGAAPRGGVSQPQTEALGAALVCGGRGGGDAHAVGAGGLDMVLQIPLQEPDDA